MSFVRSRLAAALALGAVALLGTAPALAAGERPVAYVNPDTGKETENPGVATSSSCETPAQADTMALGDEATGKGNVHVDACLFSGAERVDTKASFDVSGVGTIAACPDPDKDGPKTSTKTANRCVLDGFEADNEEYHVRVVSATAGVQTVRFCADPEGNGCDDADQVSTVRITWGAPQGGVAAGGSVPTPTGNALLAAVALGGALAAAGAGAGALAVGRARR